MYIRLTFLFSFLLFCSIPIFAQTQREIINFNKDWKFSKGNPASAQNIGFNDAVWESVRLPHDWAIKGPFDPKLSGETGKLPWKGEGWYRKVFRLDASYRGMHFDLVFDGVMAFPKVYVNGELAGQWDYGYNSFYLDITPFLKPGEDNLVAVYVDTRSHESRWYPGAGIYRKVQLIATDPVHVDMWGTQVTTPHITPQLASVSVHTTVQNTSNKGHRVTVENYILTATGSTVALDSVFCPIKAGENHVFEQSLAIANPQLWSPDQPNLYTLRTVVRKDGKPCDEYYTTFGVRTIAFTADNGFWLNGSRIQLKGVCLHHDLGALGAAFNTRAMERELEIMRDMGVNAVRTSHNAPAPELLELCDKMGLLVIDELFDKWDSRADILPATDFNEFAQRQVRNFIKRDRNHPSIFLWSVGNEIGDIQGNVGGGFAKLATMTSLFRSFDPSRPLTLVCDNKDAAANRHFDYYDVISYNYGRRYALARQLAPEKSVIVTESASTVSTRGFYELPLPAKATDFTNALQVSSYDLNAPFWAEIPDDDFKWQDDDPYVAGEFVWTGFDYLGEPTPYGDDVVRSGKFKQEQTPRSSYFGIVDLAGLPKDRYYLYKSYWNPDVTTVHILPHWNWGGQEGKNVPVFVYTNGDCAELFLNGKSLGIQCKNPGSPQSPERYRLMWKEVTYTPGILKAVAYKNGRIIGENTLKTSGPPAQIKITPDRDRLVATGEDLSYLTIEILDKDGNPCPLADNLISIALEGPGEVAGVDNGNPLSLASFQSNEIKVFYGKAVVIVRGKEGQKGNIKVKTSSKGLISKELVIKIE